VSAITDTLTILNNVTLQCPFFNWQLKIVFIIHYLLFIPKCPLQLYCKSLFNWQLNKVLSLWDLKNALLLCFRRLKSTVNKVSSLRDLVSNSLLCFRRLKPAVMKIESRRDLLANTIHCCLFFLMDNLRLLLLEEWPSFGVVFIWFTETKECFSAGYSAYVLGWKFYLAESVKDW
jgi:hypothetical protein